MRDRCNVVVNCTVPNCLVSILFCFVLNNWGYGTPTFNIQMSPNPKMKYRIPPTQRLSSNFSFAHTQKLSREKFFTSEKFHPQSCISPLSSDFSLQFRKFPRPHHTHFGPQFFSRPIAIPPQKAVILVFLHSALSRHFCP